MPATLHDVAKLAGVSPATVSRVINNDSMHPVNKKTVSRVMDAIVKLGYSPNESARNLRKRNHRTGGNYVLGTLLTSSIDSYNDPFFYDILRGIQAQTADMGYSLGFTYSLRGSNIQLSSEMLRNDSLSGLILLGRMDTDTLNLVRKNVKHIVYAGLNQLDNLFDEVICDGFACAKMAVTHLANNGRKKIGFIGNMVHSHSSVVINEYRFEGYLSALAELGLPFQRELVVNTPLNIDSAYQATYSALEGGIRPDAFFCANDYCAIGALKAIRNCKLKVPRDIAVISIDDIELAAYSRPMLSTIQVPREDLGRYAVKLLIDQIRSRRKYPVRLNLPYKLVIRESCGASNFLSF